jgi:phosphodiesterase/alkaline phosphatase D-like protein
MADLLLGPLLRHAGETQATVWVETDRPCEVEVLGRTTRTFCVEGHHYAIVCLTDLEPGTSVPYEVALDGERAWPPAGDWPYPPSRVRTLATDAPLRLAFGSCRVCAPHEPPWALRKDEDDAGREVDALVAFADRMAADDEADWPQQLMFLGDQVYADEVSPAVLNFIRSRRDTSVAPGTEVADFEEYTRLYWESWSEPAVRWVLSTIPSVMIFDDHDVHDDWNTSHEWRERVTAEGWWRERIIGAFMSYWLYQHLGNLTVEELAEEPLLREIRALQDGAKPLREFSDRADREPSGSRWSYRRDLGATRIVVVDSRAGRVLDPGHREMLDDDEWDWLDDQLTGDVDHLLIATSLPFALGGGMHDLEAWNEAVSEGAWGKRAGRLGEKMRQGLDLEHWAAFGSSFKRLSGMVEEVAAGKRGRAPASIVFLSGDVHHAYVAELDVAGESTVLQAVCSPFRNPLDSREQRAVRAALSRPAARLTRGLARLAGVKNTPLRWQLCDGPWFDNQIATLTVEGRHARLAIEKALPHYPQPARLERVLDRALV